MQYVVQPRPYVVGWKLRVEDAQGNTVNEIIPRGTRLPRYVLYPVTSPESPPLFIKPTSIGSIRRYDLMEGGSELLSLQQLSATVGFILRNHRRTTIGHFIPLTPTMTLLRTPTTVLARLQIKQYSPPIAFRFVCEVTAERPWLLATLLYIVAIIDLSSSQIRQEKENK